MSYQINLPFYKNNFVLSVQGWKRLVVGAYNCAAHRRTTGRGALQDPGGNAPPSCLGGEPGAGEGGVCAAGETREHLRQHMRLGPLLTTRSVSLAQLRGRLDASGDTSQHQRNRGLTHSGGTSQTILT